MLGAENKTFNIMTLCVVAISLSATPLALVNPHHYKRRIIHHHVKSRNTLGDLIQSRTDRFWGIKGQELLGGVRVLDRVNPAPAQ